MAVQDRLKGQVVDLCPSRVSLFYNVGVQDRLNGQVVDPCPSRVDVSVVDDVVLSLSTS